MANVVVKQISDSLIQVSGEMHFENALELKLLGEAAIKNSADSLEVNCSEVTRAGSAGVSVLLSWMRYALAIGKDLTFSHIPADLLGVAKVSDIDEILPMKGE